MHVHAHVYMQDMLTNDYYSDAFWEKVQLKVYKEVDSEHAHTCKKTIEIATLHYNSSKIVT